MRRLLNPFRYGFFAVQFWSHKVLRWLVPVLMIAILIANWRIASQHVFYQISLGTQLVCYSAAIAGLLLHSIGWRNLRILDLPFYFCLVNAASLTGIAQALAGRRYTTWSSSRPAAESAHHAGPRRGARTPPADGTAKHSPERPDGHNQYTREILRSVLQLDKRADKLNAGSPLLGSIPELDSMAIVAVLTAIEEQCGITIKDDEVSAATFETVGSLARFIEEKGGA